MSEDCHDTPTIAPGYSPPIKESRDFTVWAHPESTLSELAYRIERHGKLNRCSVPGYKQFKVTIIVENIE